MDKKQLVLDFLDGWAAALSLAAIITVIVHDDDALTLVIGGLAVVVLRLWCERLGT